MHSLATRLKMAAATCKESTSDRFWRKVHRSSDNECWEWKAGRTRFGYGRFGVGSRLPDGKRCTGTLAHRIAWELIYGPIPEKAQVLHQCDNPSCCNPSHLFLGSQRDNIDDMIAKGRQCFDTSPMNRAKRSATHCRHGHPYDNPPHIRKDGKRSCLTCANIRQRRKPHSPIGPNASKTHCIHGHPFDETNTYIAPSGKRACRSCLQDGYRRYKLRKRIPHAYIQS